MKTGGKSLGMPGTARDSADPSLWNIRRGIAFPATVVDRAAIIYLLSRHVVIWVIGNQMKPDLATKGLNRAIALRRPPQGRIHHADRGS